MNERISELLDQARVACFRMGSKSATTVGYDELEKLVELVVKECIGIVENSPSSYGDYRDQISNSTREACVEKMKQQFEIPQHKGWVCPKCGIDRTQAVCPKGHSAALTGECPMVVNAQ